MDTSQPFPKDLWRKKRVLEPKVLVCLISICMLFGGHEIGVNAQDADQAQSTATKQESTQTPSQATDPNKEPQNQQERPTEQQQLGAHGGWIKLSESKHVAFEYRGSHKTFWFYHYHTTPKMKLFRPGARLRIMSINYEIFPHQKDVYPIKRMVIYVPRFDHYATLVQVPDDATSYRVRITFFYKNAVDFVSLDVPLESNSAP